MRQNIQRVLYGILCYFKKTMWHPWLTSMLFLQVNTVQVKEAFIAGLKNGLKPLNVAALKFVDQVRSNAE